MEPRSIRSQGKPSRNSTRKIQPPAFPSCCRYDPRRQRCLRIRLWMRSASCWTGLFSIVSGSPWHPPRLQAEVVPGEAFTLHNTVTVRSGVVSVEWKGVRAAGMAQPLQFNESLRPNQPASRDAMVKFPSDAPLSQPYWLREEASHRLVPGR